MSGFLCPHCSECSNLFSSGGGQQLAQDLGITFLGKVPIDPLLTTLIEKDSFPIAFPQSLLWDEFQTITDLLITCTTRGDAN